MAKDERQDKAQIPGVEFDFSDVTVMEWAEMVDVVNDMRKPTLERVAHQAGFLAKVVRALPDGWGKPDDPATYKALRHFDQFEPLMRAMWAAVEDVRKKVS